jgi:hypothetical protein
MAETLPRKRCARCGYGSDTLIVGFPCPRFPCDGRVIESDPPNLGESCPRCGCQLVVTGVWCNRCNWHLLRPDLPERDPYA